MTVRRNGETFHFESSSKIDDHYERAQVFARDWELGRSEEGDAGESGSVTSVESVHVRVDVVTFTTV